MPNDEIKVKQQKTVNKHPKWTKFCNSIKAWSPYTKNKLINMISYLFTVLLVLGFNYMYIFKAVFPTYWFVDLSLIILSFAPIFFFRKTMFDRIYLPIIFTITTVFLCVNAHICKNNYVVFSFKEIILIFNNIGQFVSSGSTWIVSNLVVNILLIGIFISWILVFNIKLRFKETETNKLPALKRTAMIGGLLTAASLINYEMFMGISVCIELNKGVNSAKYVNFNANYHFKKFGMFNYYNREIRQMIFNKHYANDQEVVNYLSNYQKTNDYYSNLLTNNPNVFCLFLETGDQLIVNQYTMPNLYSLLNEKGLYCKHNYSINHSNVSNIISLMGGYPSGDLLQNKSYNTPFSIVNILNKKNYDTRFYNDMTSDQDGYDDLGFMKKIGFKNVFGHNEFLQDLEPGSYSTIFNPDSWVATRLINNLKESEAIKNNQPFFTEWMTMFMHMNNNITDNNKEALQKLYDSYGATLKQLESEGKWTNVCKTDDAKTRYFIYTMKTMDFDAGLGYLLDYFYGDQASDYLKNTVFVIFGDHIWYELSDGTMMTKLVKNIYDEQNINTYSTVLGVYHPKLMERVATDTSGLITNHIVNKKTSIASIVPTLLDLLGIPYNPNIYQDHSIFDLYGESTFNENNHEILYTNWLNYYMNEHYTSDNGGYISRLVDDNNTKDWFVKKVKEKESQLRILNNIFWDRFFDRYDYSQFLPNIN